MSLDFINRDLFSTDPLAKLSRIELDALESKHTRDLDAAIASNAANMLGFDESTKIMKQFIDRQVAVRLEILRRDARLRKDRGAFWIALIVGAIVLSVLVSWLRAKL